MHKITEIEEKKERKNATHSNENVIFSMTVFEHYKYSFKTINCLIVINIVQ